MSHSTEERREKGEGRREKEERRGCRTRQEKEVCRTRHERRDVALDRKERERCRTRQKREGGVALDRKGGVSHSTREKGLLRKKGKSFRAPPTRLVMRRR
jgi:hypothetical protein